MLHPGGGRGGHGTKGGGDGSGGGGAGGGSEGSGRKGRGGGGGDGGGDGGKSGVGGGGGDTMSLASLLLSCNGEKRLPMALVLVWYVTVGESRLALVPLWKTNVIVSPAASA